jgi:hypothetical protein
MQITQDVREELDVPSQDGSPDEWCRLIRKLRWIGLDHEADRLIGALKSLPPDERSSVVAGPRNTD